MKPRALTIAGSDSGGGAGIQADLKVFTVLGAHGMSVITALTAQNTVGVTGVEVVQPSFVAEQLDAVCTDIGVDAAKTGMLANASIVETVAERVAAHGIDALVCDPVFVSKHGDTLLQASAVDALRSKLLPLSLVVTPNVPEAEGLLGRKLRTDEPDVDAAKELVSLGPRWVLLKGGHLGGDEATDVLTDGDEVILLTERRIETPHTHGTGCTLSAAITAYLARGSDVPDAVRAGKRLVTEAIAHHLEIGKGISPTDPAWEIVAG